MKTGEPARISRAYLRFAEVEARGRSPLYDRLARGVAADPEIIAFLAALPKEKRQPNRGTARLSRNCRMRRRNKIAGPVPGIGERFTGRLGDPHSATVAWIADPPATRRAPSNFTNSDYA